MDPRTRLIELVEASGHNLTALSRAIGRNPGYLRDYVRKGSPAKLDEDERARLAEILGCDPNELRGEPPRPGTALPRPIHVNAATQLPILGRPGDKGQGLIIEPNAAVGLTPRPQVLLGATDAYALYVFDDAMAPAFEPGHLVWIDPSRPVRDGDDVVALLADGRALIRRLARRGKKAVTLQQWNPARRDDFADSQLKALHLIVGSVRVRA